MGLADAVNLVADNIELSAKQVQEDDRPVALMLLEGWVLALRVAVKASGMEPPGVLSYAKSTGKASGLCPPPHTRPVADGRILEKVTATDVGAMPADFVTQKPPPRHPQDEASRQAREQFLAGRAQEVLADKARIEDAGPAMLVCVGGPCDGDTVPVPPGGQDGARVPIPGGELGFAVYRKQGGQLHYDEEQTQAYARLRQQG